tara:strand:+ start:878 stop:1222 length:345 start_codon:yes stop_codon:yes gene_type:complete
MSQLFIGTFLFIAMHTLVWWSTNAQFVEGWKTSDALILSIFLAVPITLLAFYASRYTYDALDERVWSVRFIGFGVSYFVFPFLTWLFLGESMFTAKTLLCTFLSFLIIYIQIKM